MTTTTPGLPAISLDCIELLHIVAKYGMLSSCQERVDHRAYDRRGVLHRRGACSFAQSSPGNGQASIATGQTSRQTLRGYRVLENWQEGVSRLHEETKGYVGNYINKTERRSAGYVFQAKPTDRHTTYSGEQRTASPALLRSRRSFVCSYATLYNGIRRSATYCTCLSGKRQWEASGVQEGRRKMSPDLSPMATSFLLELSPDYSGLYMKA